MAVTGGNLVGMSELSDLISEANRERKWSTRAITDKARDGGFKISHGTVGKILNGTHGLIELDTVYALEHVFKVHRDRITAAAGVPRVGEPYTPPEEAVQLSDRQRKAVTELILAIVKTEVGSSAREAAPPKPAPDRRVDRAISGALSKHPTANPPKTGGSGERVEKDSS